MFEHMRNWNLLLSRIQTWLKPKYTDSADPSYVFIHIFVHNSCPYFFTVNEQHDNNDNWMSRYFFSGGMMPCFDIFQRILGSDENEDSKIKEVERWKVNGENYALTSEAWL